MAQSSLQLLVSSSLLPRLRCVQLLDRTNIIKQQVVQIIDLIEVLPWAVVINVELYHFLTILRQWLKLYSTTTCCYSSSILLLPWSRMHTRIDWKLCSIDVVVDGCDCAISENHTGFELVLPWWIFQAALFVWHMFILPLFGWVGHTFVHVRHSFWTVVWVIVWETWYELTFFKVIVVVSKLRWVAVGPLELFLLLLFV